MHRHCRVLCVTLAPGFRQIALQQLDVGDAVDDAAAGVVGKLLGEVRQHLRRDFPPQRVEVFGRIGGLHVLEQTFEGVVIFLGDGQWLAGRRGIAAATAEHAAQSGERLPSCWMRGSFAGMRGGISRLRRRAPLPPGEQQTGNNHDQTDLQDQAEDGGKAAHAAERAVTEQHAEQAGADETGRQTAQQSTAEQTAAQEAGLGRGRTGGRRRARLRHGAVEGRSRCRRGAGWRRRGKRPRAAAAAGRTAAGARIGVTNVASNEEKCSRNRGERDYPAESKHCVVLPSQISAENRYPPRTL